MISYPSDITQQQFELIRPDLEAVRQRTRPRQVDLYEIFNAVNYPMTFLIGKRFMVTSAAGQNRLM